MRDAAPPPAWPPLLPPPALRLRTQVAPTRFTGEPDYCYRCSTVGRRLRSRPQQVSKPLKGVGIKGWACVTFGPKAGGSSEGWQTLGYGAGQATGGPAGGAGTQKLSEMLSWAPRSRPPGIVGWVARPAGGGARRRARQRQGSAAPTAAAGCLAHAALKLQAHELVDLGSKLQRQLVEHLWAMRVRGAGRGSRWDGQGRRGGARPHRLAWAAPDRTGVAPRQACTRQPQKDSPATINSRQQPGHASMQVERTSRQKPEMIMPTASSTSTPRCATHERERERGFRAGAARGRARAARGRGRRRAGAGAARAQATRAGVRAGPPDDAPMKRSPPGEARTCWK